MISWGLMSTARINQKIIPAIRASKESKLIAVASRDRSLANLYAEQWNIPYPFDSYSSMLDSELIDVVYISLPNHLHEEWTIKSLEAGKHVLCEKPLALSVEGIDRMISASKRSGRILAEALMYRHHPQTKYVGELIHNGSLGEISLFRGVFNFLVKNIEDIRLRCETGGGSLWDIGVYPLSMAQFIFRSPPERVTAEYLIRTTGVDETFIGTMHYPDGGIAQISSSFRTPYYTSVDVMGNKGTLSLNRPFTNINEDAKVYFYPPDGKLKRFSVSREELYVGQIMNINASILDGTPPYLSLQESRDHIRTVVALYRSAREGIQVFLE
jgi:xylose dehydrogenase (NAD/NADP)